MGFPPGAAIDIRGKTRERAIAVRRRLRSAGAWLLQALPQEIRCQRTSGSDRNRSRGMSGGLSAVLACPVDRQPCGRSVPVAGLGTQRLYRAGSRWQWPGRPVMRSRAGRSRHIPASRPAADSCDRFCRMRVPDWLGLGFRQVRIMPPRETPDAQAGLGVVDWLPGRAPGQVPGTCTVMQSSIARCRSLEKDLTRVNHTGWQLIR